ncbi:MAG: chorismate-binding protein [Flavobacteriaceae bacterium]
MDDITIYQKIQNNLSQKIPFVSFRKPNTNTLHLIEQKNNSVNLLKNYSQIGFLFAPFDTKKKSVLFEYKDCIQSSSILKKDTFNTQNAFKVPNKPVDQTKHEKLVKEGIDYINNNAAQKIVLSRKEKIDAHNIDKLTTFKKLIATYQAAFVYIWYHPKIGLWLGATPETLLNISGKKFKTMALAGTQLYSNTLNVTWDTKEVIEQELVTSFISKQLNTLKISHSKSKATTIRAANLLHICTNFSGRLSSYSSFGSLLNALHPTPAVCGMPKEDAKKFIIQNETYDREYYTGYLGEINIPVDSRKNKNNSRNVENQAYSYTSNQSSLFVNLRCMKIEQNTINIYVGGGITSKSIPKSEYLETVSKAKVMKNALVFNALRN